MQKNQLFIVLLLALVAAGCGGSKGIPTNYVEGLVTLDGSPVQKGVLIKFIPSAADGKMATGYTDDTGKYTLTSDGGDPQKGALEGEYKVTVVKMDDSQAGPRSSPKSNPKGTSTRPATYPPTLVYITPKVYSEADKTPLKAAVKKGKNDIPLTLTSTGQ